MSTRRYKIKVYRGKDGWRIRPVAPNGKIPGQEKYHSASNALRAAKAFQAGMILAEIVIES